MRELVRSVLLVALIAYVTSVAAADSGTLLVLNKSDNTVSLIDLASKKAVATIPTGVGPHEVAVSPDGKTAVIANYGTGPQPGSTLTVIDVPGKKPLKTIDLGEYRRPHGIMWLRDREVAVTAEGSKALLIVDVSTGKVLSAVPTDQNVSHMVVVSPKHHRAFVANIGSGSVTVIDLIGKKKITDIQTGAGAEGIDIAPDEREVWVTNRAANTVSVIDVPSLKVAATLESKDFPIRVKFAPGGKLVLVSNARSGDVAVFDAATKKEIRRIPMQVKANEASSAAARIFGTQFGQSPVPVGILVAPGVGHAFVANTNADIVTMIDLKTWQIVDRLTAGKEPDGLGYSRLSIK
ncbi:MAG TPA: cytochrome D1 domain-containing protein [Pyrinomonadaceae bacterium]|nr:cytochrome D1 domain-containing protein [Pyrinomonadaceae bacterium]